MFGPSGSPKPTSWSRRALAGCCCVGQRNRERADSSARRRRRLSDRRPERSEPARSRSQAFSSLLVCVWLLSAGSC
eukprot:7195816-Pyramimonas_sp.AAC.1